MDEPGGWDPFGNASRHNAKEAVAAGLTPEILETTLIPSTREGKKFFDALKFYQPVEDPAAAVVFGVAYFVSLA